MDDDQAKHPKTDLKEGDLVSFHDGREKGEVMGVNADGTVEIVVIDGFLGRRVVWTIDASVVERRRPR